MAGSSFVALDAPALTVQVNGTAPIDRVDIIRRDWSAHTEFPGTIDSAFTWTDPHPALSETWYYVRVIQANGGFVWSTPIWITCPNGSNDMPPWPKWCDVVWTPAPKDRGPDRHAELAQAARAFGEDPARFASFMQIGHFQDTRGPYVLFRGRDVDGVPMHVHVYLGFPAFRLYASRGWSDFGWVPNSTPADQLPWPEPTGAWI